MKKFSIPNNTMVVSSKFVFKDKMPVLFVDHDKDGEWQFHSGNVGYSTEDLMLVSLSNILDYDSKLSEVSDLPPNHFATRKSINDKWVYKQTPEEH